MPVMAGETTQFSSVDSATLLAVLAAVVSALASVWSTFLNVRMVKVTKASVDNVVRQTEELIKDRVDARAPRLAIRDLVLQDDVFALSRQGGRILTPVQEVGVLPDDASLVVVGMCTVANEGEITARIAMPEEISASRDNWRGGQLIVAPGTACVLYLRLTRSLADWKRAADAAEPCVFTTSLEVEDGFSDGVQDTLTLKAWAYALAPAASGYAATAAALRGAGLASVIEALPTVRQYRLTV